MYSFYLGLLFTLSLIATLPSVWATGAPDCESHLSNFRAQLSRLIEVAKASKANGQNDPQTAKAIRSVVTEIHAQNLLGGMSGLVSEALVAAKAVSPVEETRKTWSTQTTPYFPEPLLLADLSAIPMSGVNRVFVAGVKNALLLNGNAVRRKAIFGMRLYVFLNDGDDRYPQERDLMITWRSLPDVEYTSGQWRSLNSRTKEVRRALDQIPFRVSPNLGEHLIEIEIISAHSEGGYFTLPDFEDLGSSVLDYLTPGVSPEKVYELLTHAFSANAKFVGSVRSGESRFRR